MNPIRAIRRLACILAGLTAGPLALATATPAAFARSGPHSITPTVPAIARPQLPGWNKHPPLPAHTVIPGGIPGWQTILIAAAAVLLAAAVAVTAYRARPTRRRATREPPDRAPAMIAAGLLPHTIQLCIHCRQNPAGFWVSQQGGQTVRRPWCLTCCGELDRGHYDVIPFDAATHRPVPIGPRQARHLPHRQRPAVADS